MSRSGPDSNCQGSEKALVLVGKITKPHGIKGELKIYPFSGQPDNFDYYTRIKLCFAGDSGSKWFEVLGSRIQGKMAVVRLSGVDSRNDAETLVGSEIWADPDEMLPLEEGEFYWRDLEGLGVFTAHGQELGRIKKIISTGAHDILVVTGKGQEYLIPALDEFILEINEEAGTVVVDPPEGLLEINS